MAGSFPKEEEPGIMWVAFNRLVLLDIMARQVASEVILHMPLGCLLHMGAASIVDTRVELVIDFRKMAAFVDNHMLVLPFVNAVVNHKMALVVTNNRMMESAFVSVVDITIMLAAAKRHMPPFAALHYMIPSMAYHRNKDRQALLLVPSPQLFFLQNRLNFLFYQPFYINLIFF